MTIPAANDGAAGEESLTCTAVLKAAAAQQPAVLRLPLQVDIDGKHFDAGEKLVETEKRRTWYYVAGDQVLDDLGQRYDPDIPAGALDAKQAGLWGVEWKAFESDTLIDFPLANYPCCYAVDQRTLPPRRKGNAPRARRRQSPASGSPAPPSMRSNRSPCPPTPGNRSCCLTRCWAKTRPRRSWSFWMRRGR